MRLVDQGKLKLDTPIQEILEQPLASYDDGSDPKFAKKYRPYKTLAADPHVTTAHQFPLFLLPDLPANDQRKDLNAGLGVVVFDGPQGRVFTKAGIHEITANTLVCIEASQRCVLILSNDVRAEAGMPNSRGFFSAAPASLMIGNMAIGLERLDAILEALGIMLS